MPMPRELVLHLPVALGTRQYCLLVYSVLGEVVSYAYVLGTGPALTSGPAYPTILCPGSFDPGRGY